MRPARARAHVSHATLRALVPAFPLRAGAARPRRCELLTHARTYARHPCAHAQMAAFPDKRRWLFGVEGMARNDPSRQQVRAYLRRGAPGGPALVASRARRARTASIKGAGGGELPS